MSINDPLEAPQDADRTILVPNPGGRKAAVSATAFGASPALSGAAVKSHGVGLNPLVGLANPLLDLAVPLRRMIMHPDVEGLRQQLVQAIRTFEAAAKAKNINIDAIAAARYSLCTLLDEAISRTPWGGGGVWASRSLLVTFHNEGSGGEKFFLILQKLAQDPGANIDVLELMYLCISFGLEGRYSLVDGGKAQLETLRERLYQMIRAQRKPAEKDLSPRWQGIVTDKKELFNFMPVWIVGAAAAALLVLIHIGLSLALNSASDPVLTALHNVNVAMPVTQAKPAQLGKAVPSLATFLAPEIREGLVSVSESPARDIITLRGDGLFPSGSTDVAANYYPLLNRIADALRTVTGKVLITGHTDNKPIFSLRYPSNWHLSKARAEAVQKLLVARAGSPERFSAEGRGDTEPMVPNNSPENRARNRRVDVTVLNPEAAE